MGQVLEGHYNFRDFIKGFIFFNYDEQYGWKSPFYGHPTLITENYIWLILLFLRDAQYSIQMQKLIR